MLRYRTERKGKGGREFGVREIGILNKKEKEKGLKLKLR